MLMVDLMSGWGLRNGEAAAVNLNNLVADDVYRVSEQVIVSTWSYGPLKHRKAGEYRDVPLPGALREPSFLTKFECVTIDPRDRHVQVLGRLSGIHETCGHCRSSRSR
ncbi:hypothetical protein ACWDO7_03380 [Streptomyces sp. NPDC003656]